MRSNSIKTYKVPQDVISDILRIIFRNGMRHKIKSVMPEDNIISVEIDFDTIKSNEPRQNIETILEDYREYMKDFIGDVIENQYEDDFEED